MRYINNIPIAIPVDQNMPMSESSLNLLLFDRNRIPIAESSEKIVAPNMGGNPK